MNNKDFSFRITLTEEEEAVLNEFFSDPSLPKPSLIPDEEDIFNSYSLNSSSETFPGRIFPSEKLSAARKFAMKKKAEKKELEKKKKVKQARKKKYLRQFFKEDPSRGYEKKAHERKNFIKGLQIPLHHPLKNKKDFDKPNEAEEEVRTIKLGTGTYRFIGGNIDSAISREYFNKKGKY